MRSLVAALTVPSLLLMTGPTTAWNQESSAVRETKSSVIPEILEEARTLDEVTVRGTHEDRPSSDLPTAVTVLDSRALADARVRSVRDLDALAPSISFNQLGQVGGTLLTIRGIESNPFIVNRAAVYIDGVPYRSLRAQDLGHLDYVEILRGPQGSLYGANTESGLVVIETRAPGDSAEAEVSGEMSRFPAGHGARIAGYLAGPLSAQGLSASLSANQTNADSFVRNSASSIDAPGAVREGYLQGRLRYLPHTNSQFDLIASVSQLRAPGVFEQEFVPMDRNAYDQAYAESANEGRRSLPWGLLNDAPKRTWERERVVAASLRRRPSKVRWEANLSWRDLVSDSRGTDLDLTAQPLAAGADQNYDRFFNVESRWLAPSDASLPWVLGFNIYRERGTQQLATLVGSGGLDDYRRAPPQRSSGQDMAVFGQLGLPLAETVRATAGLRLERATRRKRQSAGTLDLGSVGQFAFTEEDLEQDFNVALPRLSADWRPSRDVLLYGSIARGWIPGGFNLQASSASVERDFSQYGKETLWSREIGAKLALLGGRLQLSGALFDIKADRWQEYNVLVDTQGRAVSTNLITADASIRSRGGEIELRGLPRDDIELSLALGWVDAEYTQYRFSAVEDYGGNKVKLVPAHDFAIALSWRPWKGLFLRGDAEFNGPTPLTSANDIEQGSTVVVGLQLGWEAPEWEVRAYVDNLFARERFRSTAYTNFALGSDGTRYAAVDSPRVVGLVFTYMQNFL